MPRLSKEAERRISRALDDVANLVDAGEHPTDAIVKAARQHQLEPGHGRLLGTAYNTGRAAVQRETAEDVLGKAAEFELADPEQVANCLSGDLPKRAAEEPVADQYSLPPIFIREQYRLEKMARVVVPPLPVKHDAMPKDTDFDFPRAYSSALMAQRKAATCRGMVDRLCDRLEERLDKVASDLTALDAPTVATLRKTAEVREEPAIVVILQELCRRQPLLYKRAASRYPALTSRELTAYQQIQQLVDEASQVKQAMAMLPVVAETTAAAVRQALQPYIPEPVRSTDIWSELNSPDELDKTAAGMTPSLGPIIGGFLGGRTGNIGQSSNNDQVEAHLAALDDPQQEQRLGGIEARTTVEGLMASDPVLKGYHPDDVVDAYNNIVQAAPRAANQHLFLQGALRRYLAQGGAFDPDDVTGNVYKADKMLHESKGDKELRPGPAIDVSTLEVRSKPLRDAWSEGLLHLRGDPKWLQQQLEGAKQGTP